MNRNRYIILGFLLLIFGCKKEADIVPKEFPFVITNEVRKIDVTGATFSAEILDFGEEEIIDYGFIWIDSEYNYSQSAFNGENNPASFEQRISRDLEVGVNYIVRAYVQTDEFLVKGNEVRFQSNGVEGPKILEFMPQEGSSGTEVLLVGSDFSQINELNQVFLENTEAEIVYSNQDSIYFIVPSFEFIGEASVEVQSRSKRQIAQSTFNIIGPMITSVSSTNVYSGDLFTIEGINFLSEGVNIQVLFDKYEATIISKSNEKLEVVVPIIFDSFNENSLFEDFISILTIKNEGKPNSFEEPIIIKKFWEAFASTPSMFVRNAPHFSHGNKGFVYHPTIKILYEYNPALNSWRSVSEFPGFNMPNSLFVVLKDKVYFIAIHNGIDLKELYEYNPFTQNWTYIIDLPFKFNYATHFIIDNKVYLVSDHREVWRLNMENQEFTRLNDFPGNLQGQNLYGYVIEDEAYLTINLEDWRYDPDIDIWNLVATNEFHSNHEMSGFQINNETFMHLERKIYKLDQDNFSWSQISWHKGCYESMAALVINDRAYLAITQTLSCGENFSFGY